LFVLFAGHITRISTKFAPIVKSVVIVAELERNTMEKLEIKSAVDKIIADNNLDAKIIEIDEDEGFCSVVVEVDRKDYERSRKIQNFDSFIVSWRQKVPKLVGAEVGNFVLIYNEFTSSDSESDVGLVSSVMTEENGDVSYGCRYFKVSLNNNYYEFELTQEDYGGYKTGFLKVLTEKEIETHLLDTLDSDLKNELVAVQNKYVHSVNMLPKVIAALGEAKRVNCIKIDVEKIFQSGLSIKK